MPEWIVSWLPLCFRRKTTNLVGMPAYGGSRHTLGHSTWLRDQYNLIVPIGYDIPLPPIFIDPVIFFFFFFWSKPISDNVVSGGMKRNDIIMTPVVSYPS